MPAGVRRLVMPPADPTRYDPVEFFNNPRAQCGGLKPTWRRQCRT